MAKIAMAERLTEYAHQIELPPFYRCDDTVRVRGLGEKLSQPVYWIGRQWAVTSYGIERRDGNYVIEAARYECQPEPEYSWVRHMAGKTSVDLLDFAEALRIGRRIRQYGPVAED